MTQKMDDEVALLRSVALMNAKTILEARYRQERELVEAKEALRQSAERLQVALDAGHLGYWSWDAETEVVTLSTFAAAVLGVSPGPLSVQGMQAVIHDADRLTSRAAMDRAIADHTDFEIEHRVVHPDGERWIAARGRASYASDGRVLGMIGVVQDLTQRRRVEESLLESEERLRATFLQAAVGFGVANLDGRFVQLNRKFCDILGYTSAELQRLTFSDLTHPDDLELTRKLVGGLLAGAVDDINYEKRYLRKDGTPVWILTTVTLLKDSEGRPRQFIGSIEDVSQRKQAEEALREESRVLEILNRSGAVISSELDLTALLQAVTDAATEISGARFGAFFYNARESDGEVLQLYTLSGAPREAFAKLGHPRATPIFSLTINGEGSLRSDDILKDPRYGTMAPHFGMPKGHLPVRSYLAVPVISRSKDVLGGLFLGHPDPGVFTERAERLVLGVAAQAAVAIDNARLYEASQNAAEERRALLESEQAARLQAEKMSELKDQFLATLSHELRTPLGAILGWVQVILSRDMAGPELRRALEVIQRNARSQAQLIEDLLDIARITSGQVRLEVQRFELNAVIDAAVETARPACEAKGIQLLKQVDSDAAGFLAGDPSRLQQVIWNLLSNATKFTPRGGRVVVAASRTDTEVELRITDTGIGIKESFLPYVFDRFRQADGSPTRRHGGLGLGLAITKHLVELHGGSVRVESEGEGYGASFIVRLPLVQDLPGVEPTGATGLPPAAAVACPPDTADLSKVRVLVVDDEPDARDLMKRVLEDCGADVVTAASGPDALVLATASRFHLLISDIAMPGMDGFELLRRLRALALSTDRDMPAIAVTALARTEDRTRALRAGFRMHLSKPLEPAELVVSVASVVGRLTE